MTRYDPPDGWFGASFAALVVGLVSGGMAILACLLIGNFSHQAAYAGGGLVGFGLTSLMLWLFYWRQMRADEIWATLWAIIEASCRL